MYNRYFFKKVLNKGYPCGDARIDMVVAESKEQAWAIVTQTNMSGVESVEYLYERGLNSPPYNCNCCHCHCHCRYQIQIK